MPHTPTHIEKKKETLGESVRKAQEQLRRGGVEPVSVALRPEVDRTAFTGVRRLPGESVEDFTRRFTPTQPTQQVAQQVAVGTSEAVRARARARITPETLGLPEAPTRPSLILEGDLDRANLAREERAEIESELTSILEERLELEAEFRGIKSRAAEGVTEAGRIGIVTEASRETQEALDALNRRELVLETKLRNRNNVISEIMKFQQQDFVNATAQYNIKFSQALQLYNIFEEEADELQRNAAANLDVIINSLKEGGVENVSETQWLMIEDLEIQRGFEPGTVRAFVRARPEVKLLGTTLGVNPATGEKTMSFIYKDPITGKPGIVETIGTGVFAAPKAARPPTVSQFQAAGFASRIVQSTDILDSLEAQVVNLNPASFAFQKKLPNFLKETIFQQIDQAQRNFVNAILRRESGAAISESEFDNAEKQYFIQPGDSPEVIEQKRQNRELVERNLINESGGAFVDPSQFLTGELGTAKTEGVPGIDIGLLEQITGQSIPSGSEKEILNQLIIDPSQFGLTEQDLEELGLK